MTAEVLLTSSFLDQFVVFTVLNSHENEYKRRHDNLTLYPTERVHKFKKKTHHNNLPVQIHGCELKRR